MRTCSPNRRRNPLRYTATRSCGHGLIVVTGASQDQEWRVTQISSVTLKTEGSGIVSSDAEEKPWRSVPETRFAQAEPNLS
jgi:hypothetical protein